MWKYKTEKGKKRQYIRSMVLQNFIKLFSDPKTDVSQFKWNSLTHFFIQKIHCWTFFTSVFPMLVAVKVAPNYGWIGKYVTAFNLLSKHLSWITSISNMFDLFYAWKCFIELKIIQNVDVRPNGIVIKIICVALR